MFQMFQRVAKNSSAPGECHHNRGRSKRFHRRNAGSEGSWFGSRWNGRRQADKYSDQRVLVDHSGLHFRLASPKSHQLLRKFTLAQASSKFKGNVHYFKLLRLFEHERVRLIIIIISIAGKKRKGQAVRYGAFFGTQNRTKTVAGPLRLWQLGRAAA